MNNNRILQDFSHYANIIYNLEKDSNKPIEICQIKDADFCTKQLDSDKKHIEFINKLDESAKLLREQLQKCNL